MQSMASWKIFINPERCIGCHACEMACEQTHGGISNIKVQCAPVFCRHCEVPPCVTACYRNAIEMRNGKILLIKDLCTNCGICVFACPFGAIMTTTITRQIETGKKAHSAVPCHSEARSAEEPHTEHEKPKRSLADARDDMGYVMPNLVRHPQEEGREIPCFARDDKRSPRDDTPREREIILVHKCDGCLERAEASGARPACAATCPSGAIECKDIAQASSLKRVRTYEVHLVTHLAHREETSP
jgi:Fe-S-cluster-containing hydrogenase component 2